MDLDEVVDELYGLPPAEFTKARDARSAAARQAGDRDLAGRIKKLRRPTVSAWLANLLARERTDDLDRLLELAAALHDAQGRLAGDDLRRLTQQRRQVVGALATEAAGLARDREQSLSPAVERELVETLEAALSDRTAADVLRSGRLTGPLSYAGLGVEDPTAALAVAPSPDRAPAPARWSTARSAGPDEETPPAGDRPRAADDAAAAGRDEAALAAARRAVEAAERAVAEAGQRAGREDRRVDRLRGVHTAAADRVEEARRALEVLEAEERDAAAALADAEAAATAAADAREQAEQALTGARAALADLDG